MGRPLANIDAEQVRKLAEIGCKVKEIASFFGVTDDTIINRFSDELEKGRASLNISLRRWQLQCAQKGNATLLIWLGKQMLGQSDKSQEEIDLLRDQLEAMKSGATSASLNINTLLETMSQLHNKNKNEPSKGVDAVGDKNSKGDEGK